jgi:hypothetical protein
MRPFQGALAGADDVFDDGGDRFYRELERLLVVLAHQRRQLESPTTHSETAEAQVIMAAQRRSIGADLSRK